MKIKKSFSMLTAMAIALTANCFSANVFSASVSDPNCTSVQAGDDSTFIGKWEYYKERTEAQEYLLKDEHRNPYIYEINAGGTGFQYWYNDSGIISEDNLISTFPIEWSSSGNTLNVTVRYQVNLTEYETHTYTYTLTNNELVYSYVYHNANHTEFWRRYNSDSPQTDTTTTTSATTTTTTTTSTVTTTTTAVSTTTTPITTTTYITTPNFGDFSGDGIIDGRDASDVLTIYAKSSVGDAVITADQLAAGDINKDGILDGRDATAILTYYAKTSTGYTGTLEDFIKSQPE